MQDESELLARTKPLADPIRMVTFLCLASATVLGIEGAIAFERGVRIGAIIPASLALLLVSFAFLVGTFGKPNAIYLRAFRTDRSTARLRGELAAILGPDYRLSGIRPPREKTSIFMHFFMPGILALRYAGSKFMELEAGDDWMARLWKTYQTIRLVFIDVRETTPHVHHEIQMTLATMGVERCLFIVDPAKPDDEWRATIAAVAGPVYHAEQFHLLHAGLEGAEWERMAAELRAMVTMLPAGVPGRNEPGQQFVMDNVSEDVLRKSTRPSPTILITAVIGLALSASLAQLLTGDIGGIIGAVLWLLLLIMALREAILAGMRAWREGRLIRKMLPSPWDAIVVIPVLAFAALYGLALIHLSILDIIILSLTLGTTVMVVRAMVFAVMRIRCLAHAGHRAAAVRGSILLSIVSLPFLCVMALPVAAVPLAFKSIRMADESKAVESLRDIYYGEVEYRHSYPEIGYTCRFSDLGGDPASGAAPTPQAAQIIATDLDSGKKAGYTFAVSNCATITTEGHLTVTGFQLTAVPSAGNRAGFCTDESGNIREDPKGGTNCTRPLEDQLN